MSTTAPEYLSAQPRQRYTATSRDGTTLAVQEWGNPDGPALLFIHAWSQSHLGWAPQFEGALAREFRIVTFDQRGHGESAKPEAFEAYTDNARWADDVDAVIRAAGIERAVLVAWSLGGVVALDYLATYGDAHVAGLQFVAAGNTIGTARAQTHFGSAVAAHAGDALGDPLRPRLAALLGLQQALVHRELSIGDFGELFAQALTASPVARAGWLSRQVDHEATLRATALPIQVAHGREDAILLPKATEDLLDFAPQAVAHWYEGAGHAPHWEDPARFDADLAAFARAAFAGTAR
jgi:pimeloyl-ACP methyl ester carboxylesterase